MVKITSLEVDEPCREEMTLQLNLTSAVKECSVLSSKDLGNLISNAENGTIKWTKQNRPSLEVNVETLARNLAKHLKSQILSVKQVDEHFKYVLSGVRLLHTLYDIVPHHSILQEVLVEDAIVGTETLELIFSIVIFLSHLGEENIDGQSPTVDLYAALLACSLYLLRSLVSTKWKEITVVLLAHPKVHEFANAAFTAVRVVTNFLHAKLVADHIDYRMKSNVDDVYCLFQLCEASLQFLKSLCSQILFREPLVKNKELCGDGVLQLVQSIMKLPPCEDPHIMDVVYRLKSKVLSIMLLLCEVESASFLHTASNTSKSLLLAESTVYEVLEMLMMTACGDIKDHPKGTLQLNAMKLTEILSGDSSFRVYIILNLTEYLTRVFSQPQRRFVSTWCSNHGELTEEDIDMGFDPISVSGHVLGVISTTPVRQSTDRSNFQVPPTPFAHHKSSFLIKIIANLSCFASDQLEEENTFFMSEFIKCLQKERAPKRTTATMNLSSLLDHAKSLIHKCLTVKDLHALRWFVSRLEKLPAAQGSDIHKVQSTVVVGEGQMTDLCDKSGAQNIEPVDTTNDVVEAFGSEQIEQTQERKRKRTKVNTFQNKRSKMNAVQIDIIEKAILDQPDLLHKRAASLQIWANKLSLHGSEVTRSQLRNWFNNRRAKLARAAAKEAPRHSDQHDALTVLISDSTESPNDENYEPSPSVSSETHQEEHMEPVIVEVGQIVILLDDRGEEIGTAIVRQARGEWFGRNLEELSLCVVEAIDLWVNLDRRLPHPTEAGSTFETACHILGEMRILWSSNKIFLL